MFSVARIGVNIYIARHRTNRIEWHARGTEFVPNNQNVFSVNELLDH